MILLLIELEWRWKRADEVVHMLLNCVLDDNDIIICIWLSIECMKIFNRKIKEFLNLEPLRLIYLYKDFPFIFFLCVTQQFKNPQENLLSRKVFK